MAEPIGNLQDCSSSYGNTGFKRGPSQENEQDKHFSNGEDLSVGETNKIRLSLGLKPIPLGDKIIKQEKKENDFIDVSKLDRLKRKLGNLKSSFNLISDNPDSSLKDDDDFQKNWLQDIGTKKKAHVQLRYDETKNEDDDLTEVQLSNSIGTILPGKEMVLTLKDSSIFETEDEGAPIDVLENENVMHEQRAAKHLELRKMNQQRKRNKMVLNVSSKMIAQEEEKEENVRHKSGSVIAVGAEVKPKEVSEEQESTSLDGKIKVIFDESDASAEEGDFKPIKLKKRKTRNDPGSNRRKKLILPDRMVKVDLQEDDTSTTYIDDFEENIIKPKKKLVERKSADELAIEIRKESLENEQRKREISRLHNISSQLILDERADFFNSLSSNVLEGTQVAPETFADHIGKNTTGHAFATVELPDNLNNKRVDNDIVDHSKSSSVNFYGGIASTLQFLQGQSIFPESRSSQTNTEIADDFLAHKHNIAAKETRKRMLEKGLSNVRNKYSKNESKTSQDREEQKMQQSLNEVQDELLEDYNPKINLVYKDNRGNELTTKEAYKKLSQKFHGTRSNKKKLAKFQAKVQARNRIQSLQYVFNPEEE
ncbi:hypothetical protein KAFR_0D01570 [Kazachstania africana CBS 2517]|uniref:Uncharacterized protein n=1 Tax=Kazachstania africana (strain ATCC 22294 / BCRC 22015 / CBS 2517 / CECT 1963 / NBRC 1671 / NRRL Y-8276) TaxID=1071382 RepID=H2ATV3_KAZAF|nr:hypothetical protein KAFR_0D01570 [Kazachstania africana CBS 2517]CCF57803.1 hypothetical protein KAFR_0D01570 [Kazachstania africana CBS 2517]